ncbi:MAG TPA: glycosyltransferase family 39 protein [Bryobacteraceae bacterium]|nr:glycosyltransferase family 39 protein [Bryobacteraceae bacterium]
MKISTQGRRSPYFALLASAFFLFSGVFFVPHLGVQNDEALFASPMLPPRDWFYRIRIFHSDIALLLMSYLGTLKTLLYKLVFGWFGVSAASTRIPMLLAGAASIWLFFLLLRRLAGERAACIGCTLLAADSLFLLTTCFDWGPVALQHLLIIAGLLLAVRFYQEGRSLSLFLAFLLFGLAVWDKALALWMLSGIGIAAMLTVPRRILDTVNLRRIGIAIGGLLLGASPLLIYNLTHRFATLQENSARDFSDLQGRARLLQNTVNGQAMFGWLVEEDQDTPAPHPPSGALESLSADISSIAGHPRHSLMVYGFLLALLLAPLARGPDLRAILFALAALALAWIQMATTANAGGSVHHSILLWPLPAMVIAVSLAAATRRLGRAGLPVVLALTAILAASEALVTNEYYALMVRDGGTVPWTDAVYTLSDYLKSSHAKTVACVDWGIMDSLRLLNRGTLPLRWGGDENDPRLADLIAQPATLFLGHTAGREVFPGKTEKVTQRAAALGYKRKVLAVIGDSFGRPTFEVFSFER